MANSGENRVQARGDLAWAISVGGIATVAFAALLVATWYFASTLFLIFAGILLGVALYVIFSFIENRVTGWAHRKDEFAMG